MRRFSYEAVDSTSSEASRLLAKGQSTPYVVVAREQTSGRGRRSGGWISPIGNLYFSIVEKRSKDLINLLSLRVGVILASCLQEHVMGAVELKWPNDIFLNQKKVAGILCEVLWNDTKLSSDVILGVGVNIKSFPPEYKSSATSVFLAGNEDLTAEVFLQSFLHEWSNDQRTQEDVLGLYKKLHVSKNILWKNKFDSNKIYQTFDFTDDGSLILRELSTGVKIIQRSSDHDFLLEL